MLLASLEGSAPIVCPLMMLLSVLLVYVERCRKGMQLVLDSGNIRAWNFSVV
jgi:hypothetical protein